MHTTEICDEFHGLLLMSSATINIVNNVNNVNIPNSVCMSACVCAVAGKRIWMLLTSTNHRCQQLCSAYVTMACLVYSLIALHFINYVMLQLYYGKLNQYLWAKLWKTFMSIKYTYLYMPMCLYCIFKARLAYI